MCSTVHPSSSTFTLLPSKFQKSLCSILWWRPQTQDWANRETFHTAGQQQETALNCYAPAEGMAWPYLEGEEVLVRSLSAIEDDTSVVNMPEAERKHFRLQVKLSVHASLSVALQKVATLCETNVDLNRQRILQDLYQDLSRLPETTTCWPDETMVCLHGLGCHRGRYLPAGEGFRSIPRTGSLFPCPPLRGGVRRALRK